MRSYRNQKNVNADLRWIGSNPHTEKESHNRPIILNSIKRGLASFALACLLVLSGFAADVAAVGSGLVAHWPMDDGSGTTATDVTGNGFTGELVNGPKWTKRPALYFDGNNDYVDAGKLDITGNAMSVAAWFRAEDLSNCSSNDCRIISKATGVRTNDHYFMVSTIKKNGANRLRFRLKTNGTTSTLIASSGNLIENQWIHVAAVYDGSTMRLYKDGAQVGRLAKSGNITNNRAVACWIGGNPPNATARPWKGQIDDVRLYNRALSAQEVKQLVSGDTTPEVNQPPVAAISSDASSGMAPLTVRFNGSKSSDSDGTISSYLWNFGDGTTATGATVTHTFNTPGKFNVSLKVKDNDGATGSATTQIEVKTPPVQNQKPVAKAGVDQEIRLSSGQTSVKVALDGRGSSDADGNIVAYRWSGNPNPADVATPQVTLSEGTYTFRLEVEDNQGATASDSMKVTVLPAPTGNNTPPMALTTADATEGHDPFIVNFRGANSFDRDGAIVSYRWDFGDGEISNRVNPTHLFHSGEYAVTLTVTDDKGASHTSEAIVIHVHHEEAHVHDHELPHQDSLGKQNEHLALFDLVHRDEATHVALYSGDWNDANIWYQSMIPEDDSRVWIPKDKTVTLKHQDTARIATVRVDGKLTFDPTRNTQLNVDSLIVDITGTLEMGTETSPVRNNKTAKLFIIDRGPIDLDWDPNMLSRGLISHGTAILHGAKKTAFLPLAVEPLQGDTELILTEPPVNWKIGDTLVLTGVSPFENQDEELEILGINGRRVVVDALAFDHTVPEPDLQVYVANLSRNVMIESENKLDILQRGHVMFMHSQKVNTQYCKTIETGRTDKAFAINEIKLNSKGKLISGTGNLRGRYAFHFHRTGVGTTKTPAVAKGVVIFGSPGWGMVNHSSFLQASDNVSYNVVGSGFVGEVGNEIGYYRHNIAIRSAGSGQHETDKRQFVVGSEHLGRNDDFGHGGHGFWLQGPMIEVEDNIAVGHRHFGFVFWNRGLIEFDLDSAGAISKVGSTSGSIPKVPVANVIDTQPQLAAGVDFVRCEDVMIRKFKNNMTFASGAGLEISRHMRGLSSKYRNLGWQSVIENFTAWNIGHYRNKFGHGPIADKSDGGLFNPQSGDNGISVRYSTRVVLKNPRLLGIDEPKSTGINHNHFTDTCTIINPIIEGFDQEIRDDGGFVVSN